MRLLVFLTIVALGGALDDDECLEKYANEEVFREIHIECGREVLTEVFSTDGIFRLDGNEITCRTFIATVRCLVDRIVSDCGEDARQPLYAGAALQARDHPLIGSACVQRLNQRRKRFVIF